MCGRHLTSRQRANPTLCEAKLTCYRTQQHTSTVEPRLRAPSSTALFVFDSVGASKYRCFRWDEVPVPVAKSSWRLLGPPTFCPTSSFHVYSSVSALIPLYGSTIRAMKPDRIQGYMQMHTFIIRKHTCCTIIEAYKGPHWKGMFSVWYFCKKTHWRSWSKVSAHAVLFLRSIRAKRRFAMTWTRILFGVHEADQKEKSGFKTNCEINTCLGKLKQWELSMPRMKNKCSDDICDCCLLN